MNFLLVHFCTKILFCLFKMFLSIFTKPIKFFVMFLFSLGYMYGRICSGVCVFWRGGGGGGEGMQVPGGCACACLCVCMHMCACVCAVRVSTGTSVHGRWDGWPGWMCTWFVCGFTGGWHCIYKVAHRVGRSASKSDCQNWESLHQSPVTHLDDQPCRGKDDNRRLIRKYVE